MKLIGPCTLNCKDKIQIDVMCITMSNQATSWFEIIVLPVLQLPKLDTLMGTKGQQGKDAQLVMLTTQDGYSTKLVENIKVLCKDGKLIIPKDLQD